MSTQNKPLATAYSATGPERELQLGEDLWDYLREYSRQRPETVAIWAFAIGFVLGWKIKPW